MIIFNKIRYKNILAVGNDFIELDLDRSKTTMILGENGSGKTTFITALVFALYNKAYIKVTRDKLINSITKKDLLVEVDFTIGSNSYMVRRGIKPNVFEIYKNGQLIEVSSKLAEYQDNLEKTILKIDYKAFLQIIVLGSTNYVPFMELPAGDRRAVVEDLLDIQMFSVMNKILKQKMSLNKNALKETEHSIEILDKEISLVESHIAELQSNSQDMIDKKNQDIKDLKSKISKAAQETDEVQKEISDLLSKSDDDRLKSLESKIDKLKTYRTTISNKIDNSTKEISFFENNDDCPTCTQEISKDFKQKEVSSKKEFLNEGKTALDKLESSLADTLNNLDSIKKIQSEISEKNFKVRDYMNSMRTWAKSIESLTEEIDSIKSKNKNIENTETDIEEKKNSLEQIKRDKYELVEESNIHRASALLLKDDGIKKNAVRKYIPTINTLVNKYLADFDFFIQLELDEQFNETIKSRNRDIFSYSNFSEGQKSRISLALLFTWRELARIRNSAATNLLIMDEVFDGSLDDEGTRGLLKIIQDLSEETNIFVITHTPDKLFDKFHSKIEFELHRGFTRKVIE